MVSTQHLDDAGLAAAVAVSSLGEVAVGEVVDVADVSNCRPGYGKYDRALGIQYMLGVWDLLDRLDEEKKKG